MPLSKKRKITVTVNVPEETPIEAPLGKVVVAEPQDQTGSDSPMEKAGTQTEDTSNTTHAATQNQERQERFKALQARAVRHSSRLRMRILFYSYARLILQ